MNKIADWLIHLRNMLSIMWAFCRCSSRGFFWFMVMATIIWMRLFHTSTMWLWLQDTAIAPYTSCESQNHFHIHCWTELRADGTRLTNVDSRRYIAIVWLPCWTDSWSPHGCSPHWWSQTEYSPHVCLPSQGYTLPWIPRQQYGHTTGDLNTCSARYGTQYRGEGI